jgi:Tol biopolymer transport system component
MDESTGIITWNSQLEKVISDEGERCLCFSWLHDRSEKRYSSFSTCITLPSIVLATISGSASIGVGDFSQNLELEMLSLEF